MSPIFPVYVNAAFHSSKTDEAYIFMNNEYVLLKYSPEDHKDEILIGPSLISDGFPALKDTRFGKHGIDCAFNIDGSQAYIFSGDKCALLDYAPGTTGGAEIRDGPYKIIDMFPCLANTVFKSGIDAAFKSTKDGCAYIFRGEEYGVLHYKDDPSTLRSLDTIKKGWKSLAGTNFEYGVDAAFASGVTGRVYVFRGDYSACINYTADSHDGDCIVDTPKLISHYWPALGQVLANKNETN